MDLLQPIVSDLFNALPSEVMAGLISFATSLILIFAIRIAEKETPLPGGGKMPENLGFQISDGQILPQSGAARNFLAAQAPGQMNILDASKAGILSGALLALEQAGTAFSREFLSEGGQAFQVSGRTSGNAALVTVTELDADRRRALELEKELAAAQDNNQFLLDALESAPVLLWRKGGDGIVDWSNAAYRGLAGAYELDSAIAAATDVQPPLARIEITDQNQRRWLDVTRHALGQHESLGVGVDVTAQVEVEASLSRFVETLTGIFAHLPVGLAIFDHQRRLGMFNPALGDLLKLDAAWLARQPTLREFLEHLRENRQMPDQKDFVSWRRHLSALEEGAASGRYSEVWILPSGQHFRVIGRPHPQGALAFLFEDISDAVQQEEKRRAENAFNQVLVDRLSEAIAVFDTSGKLALFNAAFRSLWGEDAPDLSANPQIAAMVTHWQSRSEDTDVWVGLLRYVSGASGRESWSTDLRLLDGQVLKCLFAPMPDGSTLTVFQCEPGDTSGKWEKNVTDIRDTERRNFFAGLEDILLPRGVRLNTENWARPPDIPPPPRALRRIAWNMILAVVEFAPEAKSISIRRNDKPGSVTIAAGPDDAPSVLVDTAGQGGVAFRVLKQFVDRQGGTLAINSAVAGVPSMLVCTIPLHGVRIGAAESAPDAVQDTVVG